MTDDAIRVNRALAAVQRALVISHLPDPRRRWLEAFHRKLLIIRDQGWAPNVESQRLVHTERGGVEQDVGRTRRDRGLRYRRRRVAVASRLGRGCDRQ